MKYNNLSQKLAKISKEVFGEKWIIPLAKYLGITRQAVYLWLANKLVIPVGKKGSFTKNRFNQNINDVVIEKSSKYINKHF